MINPNASYKEDASYYSRNRTWPFLFNIKKGSSVLDIGCGTGVLGKLLSDNYGCKVTGLEIVEENYHQAKIFLDRVILGDVETMRLPKKNFSFDYIIFSDSLEHLSNPDKVIDRVSKLLNINGSLLIAMPNVKNYRVTIPLLFLDAWEYQDEGILDKTHLRFFTHKSIVKLLKAKKFNVEKVFYNLPLSSKAGIINLITFGLFRKHLTSHYFIKSCKEKY